MSQTPEVTNQDEEVPSEVLQAKLEETMFTKYESRMKQWADSHKPNEKFPITFTGLSEPVWLNREERRKQNKARKR